MIGSYQPHKNTSSIKLLHHYIPLHMIKMNNSKIVHNHLISNTSTIHKFKAKLKRQQSTLKKRPRLEMLQIDISKQPRKQGMYPSINDLLMGNCYMDKFIKQDTSLQGVIPPRSLSILFQTINCASHYQIQMWPIKSSFVSVWRLRLL